MTDFTLNTNGVTGAFVSGMIGSGATYTVTVDTGSGNGTIRLDVVNDDTIQDADGNLLIGGYTSGETYTISK
jgi:P pilus assembly chaperone PapD